MGESRRSTGGLVPFLCKISIVTTKFKPGLNGVGSTELLGGLPRGKGSNRTGALAVLPFEWHCYAYWVQIH